MTAITQQTKQLSGFSIFILLAFLTSPGMAQQKGFSPVNQILANIKAPLFKAASYDITVFGALADGKTDIKPVLDKVISQCSTSGGGQVVIPKGVFYIAGPVTLKSHVNLHFEEGAELIFSSDDKDYLPAVLTLWEGTELFNYSPLFYAYQCSDIAVTGHGKIIGSASKNFARWRPQRSPEQTTLRQKWAATVRRFINVFLAKAFTCRRT